MFIIFSSFQWWSIETQLRKWPRRCVFQWQLESLVRWLSRKCEFLLLVLLDAKLFSILSISTYKNASFVCCGRFQYSLAKLAPATNNSPVVPIGHGINVSGFNTTTIVLRIGVPIGIMLTFVGISCIDFSIKHVTSAATSVLPYKFNNVPSGTAWKKSLANVASNASPDVVHNLHDGIIWDKLPLRNGNFVALFCLDSACIWDKLPLIN